MYRYVLNPKPGKSVRVYGRGLNVSPKKSQVVCRAIKGMNLEKGKIFVEKLLQKKTDIDGKYYTNVAREMLSLLKSAEVNTEFKGLDPSRMFIHASAHEGMVYMTPRRFKLRGRARRLAHIQIILQQR